jgi:hypothetical protein
MAIGASAALLIAATVTATVLVTGSGKASKSARRQSSKVLYGTFGAFGISDGATGRQLLARFGSPDRKRNGCWIYRIRGGVFHGINVLPQIGGVDAVRYCFYSGVVSVIEDHYRAGSHENPFPQPWIPPLEFGCGGKQCHVAQ